jgi:hypothetical protein
MDGDPPPKGPWLLTGFAPSGIFLKVLTDEEVADWPPLVDHVAPEECS